jgi:phosphoribosylglycinamide formyltransferase 2
LHARAVLGLPIPEITLKQAGASAVILSQVESNGYPVFKGLELALNEPNSDIRLFGKPACRPYRRMGGALSYGNE